MSSSVSSSRRRVAGLQAAVHQRLRQQAAEAEAAKRRPHVQALHLAGIGVVHVGQRPQRAAAGDLAVDRASSRAPRGAAYSPGRSASSASKFWKHRSTPSCAAYSRKIARVASSNSGVAGVSSSIDGRVVHPPSLRDRPRDAQRQRDQHRCQHALRRAIGRGRRARRQGLVAMPHRRDQVALLLEQVEQHRRDVQHDQRDDQVLAEGVVPARRAQPQRRRRQSGSAARWWRSRRRRRGRWPPARSAAAAAQTPTARRAGCGRHRSARPAPSRRADRRPRSTADR